MQRRQYIVLVCEMCIALVCVVTTKNIQARTRKTPKKSHFAMLHKIVSVPYLQINLRYTNKFNIPISKDRHKYSFVPYIPLEQYYAPTMCIS